MSLAVEYKCKVCGDTMEIRAQMEESQRQEMGEVEVQKLDARAAGFIAKKLDGMCLECKLSVKLLDMVKP